MYVKKLLKNCVVKIRIKTARYFRCTGGWTGMLRRFYPMYAAHKVLGGPLRAGTPNSPRHKTLDTKASKRYKNLGTNLFIYYTLPYPNGKF